MITHAQHHAFVEALEAGEGSLANALMREHANWAKQGLTIVLGRREDIPGAHLIATRYHENVPKFRALARLSSVSGS